MRDNSQGMPEIRNAYERGGLYFGVVRVVLSTDTASFEFGVDHQGYIALKKILQTKPFDLLPGTAYRYFFTGDYSRNMRDGKPIRIGIRVEQGVSSKNLDFDCPVFLAQNLRWFQSLTDLSQAAALTRIPE